jgi:hypothetical protein
LNTTRRIAIIAIFTSLAIATDFALTPLYNVKLVFTLVFASAYAFGFRIGAAIAILTELIWGILSPNGPPTLIIAFLVVATLLYAIAGAIASKIWGQEIRPVSYLNLVFGSIMSICAFLWDTITNLATGLIVLWPNVTLSHVLFFEFNPLTLYFMVSHEIGDFVIGSAIAPVIIVYFLRVFGKTGDLISKKQMHAAISEI